MIIAAGQLLAQGPMEQIIGGAATAVRVRTPGADQLIIELKQLGGSVTTQPSGALQITGLDAPAVGAAALRAGVELHELVTERPDLEQVFLEMTEGKAAIR